MTARFHYGWRPDKPDHRDRMFLAPLAIEQQLPPSIDLRPMCPPVMNQGALGSCTAHGITGALRFLAIKGGGVAADVPLARLQLYYDERACEHTISSDAGAEIRDGIKSAVKIGVAPEDLWPYDVARFAQKPTPEVYDAAAKHRALVYERVPVNVRAVKAALASGFPVVVGLTVYDGFEAVVTIATGNVQMPEPTESVLGGHCVYCVGYDDETSRFTIRNSWGDKVGQGGDFTIPYDYLGSEKYGADYWVIRALAVPAAGAV